MPKILSPDQVRKTVLSLRVTAREETAWRRYASRTGVPLQEVIRAAVREKIERGKPR